ncbi:CHAT domain-containing protein [Actinoplanes sp. HUAS TT8]|uniref:CHAT domain-containing protein n=1 Tax=Actinoplanes sp. HUAS TT8 TaxID=3447453 RepID=UPI003F527EED
MKRDFAVGASIETIRARLLRYKNGDDDAVRSVTALIEVGALLDTDDVDLETARVCGLLLWVRSTFQSDDADHDDLIPALALLHPVWRADPTSVPEPIAEYFATLGLSPLRPTDAAQGPAAALIDHARRTGDTTAATIAVALLRRIVDSTPDDDPESCMYLSNLAMAVQIRADLTGDPDGIDEAVRLGEQAMAAFSDDDPRRAVPAAATAVALRRRSAQTAALGDLDEAITLGRRYAGTDPDRCTNLGVALTYRFEWAGHEDDIAEAFTAHHIALAAPGHPRRARHLANLAVTHTVAFDADGDPAHLDAALAAGEEATRLPDVTPQDRAAIHGGLCNTLRARFRYTGNSADLDRAVGYGEAAVSALAPGHPGRAGALANLGLARHVRAVRRNAPDDLDTAIDELYEAADATPAQDPDLAGRLSNLSDALLSRSGPGDTTEAVRRAEAAADAGSRSRQHAYYLTNLGNALQAAGELDRSIDVHRKAVDLCDPGAPQRAACLANLAATRTARLSGDDADRAIDEAGQAARIANAPVEVRIRAAVRWGHWSAVARRWADALDGYTLAVELLSTVSPRELPRADQEFELARLGGVTTDAAASALRAQQPHTAVELLEKGRGIILSHALDDTPQPGAPDLTHPGPIAMINVSNFGSDALLLRDGIVTVIPLPEATPAEVRRQVRHFATAITTDDNDAASDVLGWLWDAVVAPVIAALDAGGRLWWCPTGLLALLPLHAAGRPGSGSALDAVISSVTPNLRALSAARARPAARTGESEILIVAPESGNLPAAAAEQRVLSALLGGRAVTTTEVDPAELARYRNVHVAAHAIADAVNPSRGGIARSDGSLVTADELSRARPDGGGELMFLSACETARTGPDLADETVHLASVLHVAGYRNVVATLWPVPDRPALRLARAVYEQLTADEPVEIATALHRAVRLLRERYPNHPLVWAAYLHLGP